MRSYKGLNEGEVNQRIDTFGYNELPSEKPKNIWTIALEVVKEPMFILLVSCALLYILLGNLTEGLILLSTVFIIIFITFYQHQKTEKALSALTNLASPRAMVIRNGNTFRIAGREVVPDDIVVLNEGDRIPADGILLESTNLKIDESILTGESVPVSKSVASQKEKLSQMIFSGTLVIQGSAIAKIQATGIHTEFGKIGNSLISIEKQETRMHLEMKSLIRNLFIFGGAISIIVIIAFYIVRGDFMHALLNGLASAMSILPEEFPVVLTVFLALGAYRLSKKKVLTRKSWAIETLGSATVLCSDKTGTITQNKMHVGIVHKGMQTFKEAEFIQNKGSVSQILRLAFLASQENSIDPMEQAFEQSNEKLNGDETSNYQLLKEFPLTKSILAVTRVVLNKDTNQVIVACKGAPESIFQLCKMDAVEQEKQLKIVESIASKGYRVLAIASTEGNQKELASSPADFDFNFMGFVGLEDPIRPEVPDAIQQCKKAGIKVIMITGDYPTTAKSIAEQIGIDTNKSIMTGAELNELSEEELTKRIRHISIFARVVPEQKLRIVRALQANKEIVAMTGDGVNDAPAIKAADIGIAMGGKGTDVAREASSLVILDDNFASIVAAIRLGRRIFDNLQKAMSYIISIHIPIIGLTLLPAFFSSLPIILMPLHIVFLELIIDPVCSLAFEQEKEEENIMSRKPRISSEQFFGSKRIVKSALAGLLVLTVILWVYFSSIKEGHNDMEVRALAFSTLLLGNIFLILTDLSQTRNIFRVITERNWAVWIILSFALVMLILTLTVPFLQSIFEFEYPGINHFYSSILGSALIIVTLETIKYYKNKNMSQKV